VELKLADVPELAYLTTDTPPRGFASAASISSFQAVSWLHVLLALRLLRVAYPWP
jgi:hypothetical protein